MSTSLAHALITQNGGRSTIHWLQSLPTPLEEKNLGTLFGILEIESTDSRNDEILKTIGEELHSALYSSEHFSTEVAFEVALQKTNKKIQEITRNIGEDWLRQFNAIVGVIVADHVYFSHVGSAVALLLYKNKLSELLDHTKAKLEIINPVKVFQDTIAGDIQSHSSLFFSTETIYDYFSQEKIRRLLLEHTPENSAKHIEETLNEASHVSVGCAIITQHKAPIAASIETVPAPSSSNTHRVDVSEENVATTESDSMSRLLNKENQTSQTLSGSVWSNVKSSLQKTAHSKGEKNTAAIILTRVLATSIVIGSTILRLTKSGIKAIAHFIASRSRSSRSTYSPRLKTKQQSPAFVERLKHIFLNIWKWFIELSLIQKGCVVVALLVCIIVLSGMFNQGTINISNEKKEEYSQLLSQADVKINEAKAAMLYDKNRARTLLKEAQQLVDTVPDTAHDFDQGIKDREVAINEQLLVANGVKVINGLEPVLQFSPLATSVSISQISLLGSSIYAFDSSGGRVYRGNLDTKQSTVVIEQNDKSVVAASLASVGTSLVVLNNQTVGILKPVSESIQAISTEFIHADRNIIDARIFGSKLYLLDTKNNQIYKHLKNTELNFAKGTAWITDGTTVSSAVSFAIDGAIYVLHSNGDVFKLNAGKKEDWQLAAVDPALTSANKLVTDENTTRIYILDSAKSRILVYGKDGALQAQYQSSVFAQAKDIIVDETKKTLYVLSNNSVYTVAIE